MATSASRLLKVVIAGDASGAIDEFRKVETSTDSLGGKLSSLGTFAAVGAAGIAAATVGIGVGLFKVGESFDEAYDKIRGATGATGDDLDNLKARFKTVVSDVPTDFGKASDAIDVITQKLGGAVDPSGHLAEQFLELSRITKTDLAGNLGAGTDAINQWNIAAAQQPAFLDQLYKLTQLTGVSFADLSSQLTSAGPVFQAAGLSWDQSAALLGTLGKAGLDVSDVLPALSKGLATAAKEGKDASSFLGDAFMAIKNAPDATTAAGIALQDFGARAGPKLAELIRTGRLSYQDLLLQMKSGGETILEAGKKTQDFGEKWELIKNRVLVALEPLAMAVFDAIGNAMDALGPKITQLSQWFNDNLPAAIAAVQPWVDRIMSAFQTIGDYIVSTLVPALISFGKWLIDHKPILEGIAVAIGVLLVNATIAWATAWWELNSAALIANIEIVAIAAVIAALAAGIIWAYQNVDWFRSTVDALASFLTGVVWPAIQLGASIIAAFVNGALEELRFEIDVISTVIDALQHAWTTAWSLIGQAIQWVWDTIIKPIADKVGSVIDTIKSGLDAISGAAGAIGGVAGDIGGALGFAEGGLVPGPVGKPQLAVVHGGEYVLTSDQVSSARSFNFTPNSPAASDSGNSRNGATDTALLEKLDTLIEVIVGNRPQLVVDGKVLADSVNRYDRRH